MSDTPVISIENIIRASYRLNGVITETPLQLNQNLSERFGANIYLKREDLQVVRSYKIRGAYNCIANLSDQERAHGVVCASAGNHAQGFAHSCNLLKIFGTIYMPATTPSQKINQVKRLGKQQVEVILSGDTYDAAYKQARSYCEQEGKTFIHPFDDARVIEGQGTVGMEILNAFKHGTIDYLFIPVGGGGLCAGVATYFDHLMPQTQIIGVEPQGAPAMLRSLESGKVVTLQDIDKFVDGAAVQTVGKINFEICKKIVDKIILIPEGKICTWILRLYNEDAIVIEPAGVLSIAALDQYSDQIKGKNVVCIISGGNNDIERMPEIKERSLIYEGLKHYFVIQFPQRAGAFREFLNNVVGDNDNITDFEYNKKTNRSSGPALVGIEFAQPEDYETFIKRMSEKDISYTLINNKPDLFGILA